MQQTDPQFSQFILTKSYKTSQQFNNSPKSLLKLLNYVKSLPLEQQTFDIIYDLLKFYRAPIFIACQPVYERLGKVKEEVGKFEESLLEIAAYVKGYLQGYQLEELKFFYVAGIGKKKKKIPEKSEPEIEFLKYIENLGKLITKLKKQINSINPAELKLQLDTILAGGLDRKLNTLELYYEQYFKNQADKIYKEYHKKIQGSSEFSRNGRKVLEAKPEFQSEKKVPLCCRPFFYDRENIKQPENLVLEYKNYYYPFRQQNLKILKKTVCGFLNTNGGTIFLGIRQDIETKKREIVGMQLNESQKQNLTFTLRKDVISLIEPDIISNKNYSICFVPVKHRDPPHHYISGRYLTKITIGYGLRNQIYSYKHEDRDYFAFRTENQVIHREGREILNAYRERFKNPLPIPVPVHEGACVLPEEGRPIIGDSRARRDQPQYQNNPSYNYNSNPFNPSPERFDQRYDQKQKQKRKYKEKDAADFIIMNISQKDLLKELPTENTSKSFTIWSEPRSKICFLKLSSLEPRTQIIQKLSKLQSQKKCQFYEPQRGLVIGQDCSLEEIGDFLEDRNLRFNLNQKKRCVEFKRTQEAVQGFLLLKEQKVRVSFQGV